MHVAVCYFIICAQIPLLLNIYMYVHKLVRIVDGRRDEQASINTRRNSCE